MRRLFSFLLSTCVVIGASPFIVAQITVIGSGGVQTTTNSTNQLSVDDVIKMSKAGLSEEIIIQQIKKNAQWFDLSTDQLIRLKKAGVIDSIIKAMITPPVPQEAKVSIATASAAPEPKPDVPDLPSEVGLYAKRKGQWIEILPEIVDWKTGGVVKSIATAGVVKGDVNGHVNGKSSQLSLTQPLDLLVVAPEGIAITEYQLLRLHQNSNNREFRTVTGGVMHVSSGATRDNVDFRWSKVSARKFTMNFDSLSLGEYGILPPGSVLSRNAAGSQGKMYTFKLAE